MSVDGLSDEGGLVTKGCFATDAYTTCNGAIDLRESGLELKLVFQLLVNLAVFFKLLLHNLLLGLYLGLHFSDVCFKVFSLPSNQELCLKVFIDVPASHCVVDFLKLLIEMLAFFSLLGNLFLKV